MSKKTMKAEYVRATKDVARMGNTKNFVLNIVANYKDKDGKPLEPEYSEVLLFNEAAEKFGNPNSPFHIKKGQSLDVEGRFQKKKWTDKNGNVQVTDQILVSDPDAIKLHEKSNDNNSNGAYAQPAPSPSAPEPNYDDEDSPFN